jgi:hypothetical protein
LLLATSVDNRVRDGRKALESAMRACDLAGRKTHDPLYALAAAQAEVGDFRSAVVSAVTAATRSAAHEERIKDAILVLHALASRPLRENVAGGVPVEAIFFGINWQWNSSGGQIVTVRIPIRRGAKFGLCAVSSLQLMLGFVESN